MSGKATAEAPSNIAFVKYWGTRDAERVLPANPSISMTLSVCVSRCTVERLPGEGPAEVLLVDERGRPEPAAEDFAAGVRRHLERLSAHFGTAGGFRVATANTFPTGAGIASSASGFAALALAAAAALGREVSPPEHSHLARLSGSGSAARSAFGGYVEWPAPGAGDEAPAAPIAGADHWALADVIAVVDDSPKEVSSREGHRRAPTSPYFERRLELLPERLERIRAALVARDIAALGPAIEEEALDLHLIALSSRPPIHYWHPGTLAVLAEARRLRAAGLEVWATIDAGPNVHLICQAEDAGVVHRALEGVPEVRLVLRDRVGPGPRLLASHLI